MKALLEIIAWQHTHLVNWWTSNCCCSNSILQLLEIEMKFIVTSMIQVNIKKNGWLTVIFPSHEVLIYRHGYENTLFLYDIDYTHVSNAQIWTTFFNIDQFTSENRGLTKCHDLFTRKGFSSWVCTGHLSLFENVIIEYLWIIAWILIQMMLH